MYKMRVTHTVREESITAESKSMTETTDKMVKEITERNWNTENLKIEILQEGWYVEGNTCKPVCMAKSGRSTYEYRPADNFKRRNNST